MRRTGETAVGKARRGETFDRRWRSAWTWIATVGVRQRIARQHGLDRDATFGERANVQGPLDRMGSTGEAASGFGEMARPRIEASDRNALGWRDSFAPGRTLGVTAFGETA